MKAETLETLRKEATEALRRYLCGFDAGSAQSAATMLSVLTTLDGMTAEDIKPNAQVAGMDAGRGAFWCANAACRYKSVVAVAGSECDGCVHDRAVMVQRQQQNEAATLAGALSTYAMPKPPAYVSCLFSDYDKGTCTLQRGHFGAHDFWKARGRNPDSPIFQEALRKQTQEGGVGVVTPPRPPKPCPTVGCSYVAGHNADCNVQENRAAREAQLVAEAAMNALKPMPKFEHAHTPACDDPRACPTGNTYAKPKSMLLDGPAPTPAQVGHIRNNALEAAAHYLENLNPSVREYATAASVLRDMKSKGGG